MWLGEPVGLKLPIDRRVRPGQATSEKWALDYPPDRRFHWIDDHARCTVLFYFCKYLRQRLFVQLFDHVRVGTWSIHARRVDDANYTLQSVPRGLFAHPDMLLNYAPRGDWFRPEQRAGWPPPATDQRGFEGLILRHGPSAAPLGEASQPNSDIATKKPPFNAREAKALLAAKKVGGTWTNPPTETESVTFLLLHFSEVPRDPHRKIRHELWPNIRRGPRRKSETRRISRRKTLI
jgi:hypothetical protein